MSKDSADDEAFRTANIVRREDDNIHPRELSGDQHQESSILASYANHTKANFFLSVTIIMKTTVGAGIISLPYTINKLGYVLSIVAFLVFFALNQFCSVMLLKSKNLSRHSNYSTILHYIWRSDASRLFGSALIFVDNLGTCILEFILIKSSIRNIAKEVSGDPNIVDNWYLSEFFIIIVFAIIEFPLVLIKKIEKLRIFSFMGVGGVIVFVFGIIILYAVKKADGFPGMHMEPFPRDWFAAASASANIVFAFDFQMNFFPIFKGLKDPTDKKMEKACLVGLIGCAIPYLTVGFIGYSLAGDNSNANFLTSIVYSQTNTVLYYIVNASYIFSILFAIVLMFFGSRNNFISIVNILRKRSKAEPKKFKDQDEDQNLSPELSAKDQLLSRGGRIKKTNKQYILFTIILYLIIVIASIFLQSIELIFNFLGAICQTLVAFLLPTIFYVMLIRKEDQPKKFIYYFSWGVIAVIAPYSLFSVIASYIMG